MHRGGVKRVVLGMSGGVDSTVSAILLKRRGFEVIGVFMRNWDGVDETGVCTADKDCEEAERVASKLDIKFNVVNFVKEYWNEVFTDLIEDYSAGLTPNPDILCNSRLKFTHFHEYAKNKIGCDAVATGHYARNSYGENLEGREHGGPAYLLQAVDRTKDQSFFLSQINQNALQNSMFPVGEITKKVVKEIARQSGFPEIANKKESMGICFVGKKQASGRRGFQEFISEYITAKPGDMVDIDTGDVVGQHKGVHQWTVGQKTKILLDDRPFYVVSKDAKTNVIQVASDQYHPSLYSDSFFTTSPHWISDFSNLITQGMVKGQSYRVKGTKQYLAPDKVEEVDGKFVTKEDGSAVIVEWEKMSKSKHNGVDPSLLIDKYGCDTVRMMMLTNVSPQTERNWSEKEYVGMRNLQIKLWKMVSQVLELQNENLPELRYDGEMDEFRAKLREAKNQNLRLINFNYHVTRNTAVVMARIHAMCSAAWVVPGQVKRDAPEFQEILGSLIICLAPIAPHFCSELWAGLASSPTKTFHDFAWDKGVFEQDWPSLDSTYNLPIKVRGNNTDLCVLNVARWRFNELTVEDAFDLACHNHTVQEKVLPYDITNKHFKIHKDFEITLNLEYAKSEQAKVELTPEQIEEVRAKRAEEKEAKKAAKLKRQKRREELQKHLQEVNSNKAAISIRDQKKYS